MGKKQRKVNDFGIQLSPCDTLVDPISVDEKLGPVWCEVDINQ